MPDLDPERLETVFRAAALEAGAAIMEVYRRAEAEVHTKADASPVTEADLAADAVISRHLAAAFPDILVVTEEQAATHAHQAARFFIVDPLDGTKEFIRRGGDFTVNIALVEDGVPRFGVVYAPACARLFQTRADGVSVEEEAPFADTPGFRRLLRVARPGNEAPRIVASKSHRNAATDAYLAQYPGAALKSAGSSLKFCLIAAGEADLYPRLGPTMEWDTAAGHAVVLGAGGQVVQLPDHIPLTYGKPGYANPHFLAFAPGVVLKGESQMADLGGRDA